MLFLSSLYAFKKWHGHGLDKSLGQTENIFSTVILASHSLLQFVAFIGVVVRLS